LVHELFIADVPEIAEEVIIVQELAREPGFRTKIAVHSDDGRIDCVGACVGPRGTRIRNIINELGGEKIDIIPWSDIPETFIANALAPARISRVYVDRDEREAIVVVPDDQLSLAIGKKGQNVRLTCRLTRWNVEVKSETEFEAERVDEGVEGNSEESALAPAEVGDQVLGETSDASSAVTKTDAGEPSAASSEE
jgi:N utilization substance protein A